MILDSLVNSSQYETLGPRFARAFQWLRSVGWETLPDGRIDLESDDLYALVSREMTKPLNKTKWVAHRTYAEIHCLFEGREALFWESLERTSPSAYREDLDVQVTDAESWVDIEVPAGQFVVLFPGDAHRTDIEIPGVEPVTKIVVRVRL